MIDKEGKRGPQGGGKKDEGKREREKKKKGNGISVFIGIFALARLESALILTIVTNCVSHRGGFKAVNASTSIPLLAFCSSVD
jgi:hypothetical protein